MVGPNDCSAVGSGLLARIFQGGGSRSLSRQLATTLALIFAVSLVAAILLFDQLFGIQAQSQIDQRSSFLMDSMLAVREYTSKKVNPLVAPLNEEGGVFRPEAVPSYSANTVFDNLRAQPQYKQYSYREATLNPTNLRDKADSFETTIIEAFRQNGSLESQAGFRSTSNGRFHYVAQPIRVSKQSCLACHSTPDRAPKSQLLAYGDANGFGWKMNEIVGAQIVSVPVEEVIKTKNQSLLAAGLLLLFSFVVVALVTDYVLTRLILRPMRTISLKADEASVSPAGVTFDEKGRGDEIGLLARSFDRMKQSLAISMQMLKDRPRN